jgi:hypothetical protein
MRRPSTPLGFSTTLRAVAFMAIAAAWIFAAPQTWAATFTLINLDSAGEGFNDPTAAAPVGDNPGITLGQQRLNVFRTACSIWGAYLLSSVNIRVEAKFDAMTPCDATSGVLGRAGAVTTASDFTGAPIANTWYSIALANKLAGTDLAPSVGDITATFNSSVDNSTCLGTTGWYYGYDHDNGTNIDLLTVVLHELGHGLGFQTFTNVSTGGFQNGRPDIYARNLFDDSFGLRWDQMTSSQRSASAVNTGQLVWNGQNVTSAAPHFLGPAALVRIDQPASIAGEKDFGTAEFGPSPPSPAIAAEVILADDGVVPTTDACGPLVNAAQIAGKIALIDRGTCTFVEKAQRAQAAGAVAVIIGNNVAGAPPGMAGSDPSITIPVVSITQDDAALIQNEIAFGTPVFATIGVDPAHIAGTDTQGKVRMYAPAPLELGSSVSHFDVTAEPSLLMEPFITNGLTSSVDLTQYALADIGWLSGTTAVAVDGPRATVPRAFSAPNPFSTATAIRFGLTQPGKASIEVFDARGALVKRLPVAWRPAGPQSVRWDGTDAQGRRTPAGVYFWRVRMEGAEGAQGAPQTGRMVRVE